MTLGFMRGAIGFFITSIIAALLLAIVDTLGPKIISVTVDNVLGNKPAELPGWALSLIDSLGNFPVLQPRVQRKRRGNACQKHA